MKRLSYLVVLVFILTSCSTMPPKDMVFQASTIDALLAGVYDGEISYNNLLKHGDFGIGTFDHLDGEMLLLDGKVYQVKADGKVYEPPLSIKTPFAAVCSFNAEKTIPVPAGSDYKAVENLIDTIFPNKNLFNAIKITGHFTSMKTRSVPRQQKPYPALKEVTKNQPEFYMTDISGTIVGFRCPAYVKGINVPGYHMHFISDDKTKGGHILSFKMARGKCEIDVLDKYYLTLPSNTTDFAKTDLTKDRTKELKDVEQ